MSIEEEILKKIRPTEEDVKRIDDVARILREKVETYLKENHIDATTMYAGSYSKGTYLSNPDLDLFVLFPPGTPRDHLEKTGLKIGEDILHGQRMYAEHPYTTGFYMGVEVDLVPAMNLLDTNQLQTAVDRTPFHTRYVLSHIKPGQGDEARLLKKFMKGIKTYGAEPDIRGFPGYLCELLILKYGSFHGALEAAATKWNGGCRIDLEGPGPKIESAMVFYDPVDSKRNVASAVHMETLARFIQASKDYLACPSEKFFFPETRQAKDKSELKALIDVRGTRLVTISFKKPDVIKENIYSQLWKSRAGLEKKLNEHEFRIIRCEHDVDDEHVTISFELENDTVRPTTKHMGPPVWVRQSAAFLDKWKDNELGDPFVENGRWTVIVRRPYTSAKEMLQAEAALSGIGREFDLDTLEVLGHEETFERCNAMFLTELIVPKYPWRQ